MNVRPIPLPLTVYKVTRALLCRNHSRANANVEMLFNLFGDERIGWDVARAIGELGREERVVLTKKNDCIIRVRLILTNKAYGWLSER